MTFDLLSFLIGLAAGAAIERAAQAWAARCKKRQ